MGRKEKMINRLLSLPSDYTYDEARTLLVSLGFREDNKGKTSGSRVKFVNNDRVPVTLHRPHPGSILDRGVVKDIILLLEKEDII